MIIQKYKKFTLNNYPVQPFQGCGLVGWFISTGCTCGYWYL